MGGGVPLGWWDSLVIEVWFPPAQEKRILHGAVREDLGSLTHELEEELRGH